MKKVAIYPLTDKGDQRGYSFVMPSQLFNFLETIQEMHVVELLPNAIRGNHRHPQRKEALIVHYESDWLFAWQTPDDSMPHQQIFTGKGAALITLEANVVHALKNISQHTMTVISCSNLDIMDTVWQVIIE